MTTNRSIISLTPLPNGLHLVISFWQVQSKQKEAQASGICCSNYIIINCTNIDSS